MSEDALPADRDPFGFSVRDDVHQVSVSFTDALRRVLEAAGKNAPPRMIPTCSTVAEQLGALLSADAEARQFADTPPVLLPKHERKLAVASQRLAEETARLVVEPEQGELRWLPLWVQGNAAGDVGAQFRLHHCGPLAANVGEWVLDLQRTLRSLAEVLRSQESPRYSGEIVLTCEGTVAALRVLAALQAATVSALAKAWVRNLDGLGEREGSEP